LHFVALRCTSLHFVALRCTSLHFVALRCASLRCTAHALFKEKEKFALAHADCVRALLDQVKERSIDSFVELEESILKQSVDAKNMTAALHDHAHSIEDRMRLFGVYFMNSKDDDARYQQLFASIGCSDVLFAHLRRIKAMHASLAAVAAPQQPKGQKSMLGNFRELVGNLAQRDVMLQLTRIVDGLMEKRPTINDADYLYLDPKSSNS
jgi:hypothetical protein